MKSFLIIGLGSFGMVLARELWQRDCEVVAVDRDRQKIDQVADFTTHAIEADITDQHVLEQIGPCDFDQVIIAFSNNIEDSILLTVMLKEMGVVNLVAKARDPLHGRVLEKLGVSRIILPEREMGVRLAQVLCGSNLVDYLEIAEGIDVAEIHVPADWAGKSIAAIDVRRKYGLNILAVKSEDNNIVPSPGPEQVLQQGDLLIVMGSSEAIDKADKL